MIWIRSPLAAGIRRPRHGFRLGRQPISLYQLSLAGIVGDGDAREDVVKGQVITCDQPPSARSRSLHRAGVTAAPNGLSCTKARSCPRFDAAVSAGSRFPNTTCDRVTPHICIDILPVCGSSLQVCPRRHCTRIEQVCSRLFCGQAEPSPGTEFAGPWAWIS